MEQINVKRRVFHLNILPPRSLLMLTSLMSFPKHQTTLRNAPHLKKQQDKENQLILQAQPGAFEAETFQKKPQEYV